MKLVTASQMRELDRQTIEGDSVPQQVLMERAGTGVAMVVRDLFPYPCLVTCMVGKGNNGGDAQVAARILEKWGYKCTLCPVFDAESFDTAEVIIDGLLGTGTRCPLSPELADYITCVNTLRKPVVAIDVPSGLDADSGESCGAMVCAVATVTMGLPKLGLFLGEGPNMAGKVSVTDIGITPDRIAAAAIRREVVTESEVAPHFPPRDRTAHKGDFGHVLVVAGSRDKMGAGLLAARGALRSGAGLVTYALPESAFEKFDTRLPEIMVEPVADKGKGQLHPAGISRIEMLLQKKTAVVLGPGIGTTPDTAAVVAHLLEHTTLPIVLDADALNIIATTPQLLKLLTDHCVLTPHPGEMARLISCTSDDVQKRRLMAAEQFAEDRPGILVLKGACTITATGVRTWINPTGNPGMASAGMGDVLAGVIGGLLAQGLTPETAAYGGVFVHGLAGDIVAGRLSLEESLPLASRSSLVGVSTTSNQRVATVFRAPSTQHPAPSNGSIGILATDVANAIPQAIASVQSGTYQMIPVIHPKVS